jgi:hypothetical protein
MTTPARHLSLVTMESTIPGEMTVAEWCRSGRPRGTQCDHLHESTSRYDPAEKQLDFLLVCPVCKTERLVDTVDYEPRYEPTRLAA